MLHDTAEQYKKLITYMGLPVPMPEFRVNKNFLTTSSPNLGYNFNTIRTHTMTPQERLDDLKLTQQWYLCISLGDDETVGKRTANMVITDDISRVKKALDAYSIVYTYPQHVRVTEVKQEAVTA